MEKSKIDERKYFEFLGKLVDKNLLHNLCHLKSIKNFNLKKRQVDLSIVEIKLDNDYYLLVEDLPHCFLLSYTIIVGENAKLFEFEFDLVDA